MRKNFFAQAVAVILGLLIIQGSLPMLSVAAETTIGTTDNGVEYKIFYDEVSITGYIGDSNDITIPSIIEGYPVTNVGCEAFLDCTNITSITIPDSITSIDSYAFYNCVNLKTILIPEGVRYIGMYAFLDCTSLNSISFPKSIWDIDETALEGVSDDCIVYGYLGTNVDMIADTNSLKFISLGSVNTAVPEGLEYSIGFGTVAISGYNGDSQELVIPDYINGCPVTQIYRDVFYGKELTDIALSENVMLINRGAFGDTAYYKDKSNWDNGVLYVDTALVAVDREASGTVEIKDGTTVIADGAFNGCRNITKIIIPNSVKGISPNAFSDCEKLTTITIPNSVQEIYGNPFSGCNNLKEILVDSNNDNYLSVDGILYSKDMTELVSYPNGKTELIYTIPNSITTLFREVEEDTGVKGRYSPFGSSSSFGSTTNNFLLEVVNVPKSVSLEADDLNGLFFSCQNLKELNVDNEHSSLCSIGGIVFSKDKTELIYYPRGRQEETYSISNAVTRIGDGAFEYCIYLKNINIPYGVKEIGDHAFFYCSGISGVVIPDSVTSIEGSAFSNCYSLVNISMSGNIEHIGEDAFKSTGYYNSYYNNYWTDSALYLDKCLIKVKEDVENGFSIKNDTVLIADGAFRSCNNISDITIPKSVKHLGKAAFINCKNIKNVKLSGNISKIEPNTFYNCTNLQSIIIPDKVTDIGYSAFELCTNLKHITIPENVTNIDADAFRDCYAELTIYGFADSYVETYAKNNSINFDNLIKLTDNESNITVLTGSSANLKVETIVEANKIDEINLILNNGKVISLFDIALTKNGVEVQPEGEITVKIPTDNETSKVYRKEADGTLTDMNAIYVDGYMVFTTDHFSIYVLAEIKGTETTTPTGTTEPEGSSSTEPFTGGNTKPSEPTEDKGVLGDVNGDGKVNIKDATQIQKFAAKLFELTEDEILRADVNNDSKVNVKDATVIQKYVAKFETGYLVGEPLVLKKNS